MNNKLDNYTCSGQIELLDYLDELSKETEHCLGCIYYIDFKCVRSICARVLEEDGWEPLWYDKKNHVFGKWPICGEWLPVETMLESPKGKIYIVEAEAKDKCFKWPKDTTKNFDDAVIAWRYKGEML